MNKGRESESDGRKIIADNKKARFNYHIVEAFEAGIVLTGDEIKSIRNGKINLAESFIRPVRGELMLYGAHISQYSHSAVSPDRYDPIRPRKLLMHRGEIDRLTGRVEAKGLTLIPLKVYLKRGKAKVEIALAKGKDAPDKRQSIKDRDSKRELERALKKKR